MSFVTLYTRQSCCLCDRAKEVLTAARRQAEFELQEVDIDSDPELRSRYNHKVPVVAVNGREVFQYKVSLPALLKELKRA